MAWGGWRDWDTFREHYLGEFSPEAIKRERAKVDFLGGGTSEGDSSDPTLGVSTTVSTPSRSN